jgi:hypothetical protein
VRVNRATQERESAFYGGSWGSLEAQRHLRNLTTNQKVAGSSPAERTPESPAKAAQIRPTMSHQLDIIPVVAAPLGLWEHSASQARADHPSEGLDLSIGHLVAGLEGVRRKEEDVFDPSFLLSPHQPFGAVLRLPKEAEGVTDSVRKRIRDALRV